MRERHKGWWVVVGGVPVSDWDAWWERDNEPLSLPDICLSQLSGEGWEVTNNINQYQRYVCSPHSNWDVSYSSLTSPENRESKKLPHITPLCYQLFVARLHWKWKAWCLMLCTVIYSFYQHRGRRGVFVFDTPALSSSLVSLIGQHLISQVLAYN